MCSKMALRAGGLHFTPRVWENISSSHQWSTLSSERAARTGILGGDEQIRQAFGPQEIAKAALIALI